MTRPWLRILALATLVTPGAIQSQRWKAIGTTSSRNVVSKESRSGE